MDFAEQLDLIGQEVVLTGDAHEVETGMRGYVTGYGTRHAARPIQVTFDDADRTVRYYDAAQFGALFTVLS
jgi:hypothetical protein